MAAKKKTQLSPPLARLFPDHPADARELEFKFEGLAMTLAELALNPENRTPFAAVVKGGWGRGKTTLLRRVQRLLEKPELGGAEWVGSKKGLRRVETLWFNAWKYPGDDTVLAGLLGALLDKLRKGDLVSQLKEAILEYRGAAAVAILRLAAPERLKSLLEVKGKMEPVHEKRAFHDSFRDLFSQVSYVRFHGLAALRDTGGVSEEKLWTEEKQREATLAVFLDDLDRCPSERVVEVLAAVNLFLDLPGVSFYLGIDWPRLLAALPEAVKDEGDEFLEKIVQVAFDLPEVSETDAGRYIGELIAGTPLEELMEAGDGETPGDVAVLAGALKRRNPRHVKRFLNDLSMGLAVLRNTGDLGSGEGQVSEQAVLAWHLLAEVLPAERWREVRALPANLKVFLREWEELPAPGEEEAEAEAPEKLARLRRRGLLERHIVALRALDDAQIHALHLASPPETAAEAGPAIGRADLFDLASDAWVELPGGEFEMGSNEAEENERPPHPVRLSPFRISRHPVTCAEYAAYVRETGKEPPAYWEGGSIPEGKENHPVVQVSWSDARAFCVWLTKKRTAKGDQAVTVDLPSEAQWEYAARGSEGRTYPWGDEEPTADHANFGTTVGDTSPVGSYAKGATSMGIRDLAGNVWEWCRDWYGPYPEDLQVDPVGPPEGSARVLRGGSFDFAPKSLRGAYRNYSHPVNRDGPFGFRVVWSSSGGLA